VPVETVLPAVLPVCLLISVVRKDKTKDSAIQENAVMTLNVQAIQMAPNV